MQAPVGGIDWRRIFVALGVVALAVALLWFATRIPRTVTIFVIAAFLASAIHPVVVLLERRRISRIVAIAIVYVVLILVITVSALIVLPLTFVQLQSLAAHVPRYLESAQNWLQLVQTDIQRRFPAAKIPTQAIDVSQLSSARLSALVETALASIGTVALNVATALFIALSSLILSFFFLLNHRQLAEGFASFFPARKRETARQLAVEIVQMFGSFIAGQALVSAITGILIAAITAIFGFKFALLLGLVSAVAYAVPIIGMLAASILGLLLAAPQGWGVLIGVQVVMFVVARVSDNVFVPKIMGDSVGVSPIAVMFAVFAGGELFGLPGMILGIPAAALIKILWRYFVAPWLHGEIAIADGSTPSH